MDIRSIGPGLRRVASGFASALPLVSLQAAAASGLAITEPDALWPQWRARIALQTASLSPVSLAGRAAGATANGAAARGLQGGSVLGDYTFARPSFGAFRASGGLLISATGGLAGAAPALGAAAAAGVSTSRVDLSVYSASAALAANSGLPTPFASEAPATMPYLGLGFTGAAWRSVAITADVGLVAERLSNAAGLGRAVFGNQAMDSAMRDLRLSPVLQLGVRYTF